MQDARGFEDLVIDDMPWFKSYEFAVLWEQAYAILWCEEDANDFDSAAVDDFDKAANFRIHYHTEYPKLFCFDSPAVGYIL